jgi:hypothetical protein
VTGSFLLAVATAMATLFVLHVAIWRLRPANSPRMTLLFLLVCVSTGISLLVDLVIGQGGVLEAWAVLWTDLSLAVFYVIVYSVLARSVSVTLLGRMLQEGCNRITIEELVKEYESSSRFEDRVRLLCNSGLARLSQDSLVLTAKGFRLARCAKAVGAVIGRGLEG